MLSAGSYEQTTFKPHVPGNLAGSRNVPHECIHCHITKPPGAPAFPICAGCKLVRYCSREHQVAHWKAHKSFCKSQKHFNENTLQSMRASSEMSPSGLTVKEEMSYQQDDFCRLHMWTLRVAMECCIHETRYQFDVKKRFMRIGLEHLPNGDGNPAKTFTVKYVWSDDLSDDKNFDVQFATMVKEYESYVGTPGYKGLIMCTYDVEGLPIAGFPIPIYEYDPLRNGPFVTGWYDRMKLMMDNGIVHRLFDGLWKSGIMVRKGKKWVFRERSREQLFADLGIRVLY